MPLRVKWLIALACAAIPAAVPAAAGAAETVPAEVIVRYADGTSAAERAASRASLGAEFEESLGIKQSQRLRVRGSVRNAVERLNRRRDVLYAQPNYVYRASAPVPNDAFFDSLWGLRNFGQDIPSYGPGVAGIDTRALGAWDITRGSGAVIAIVDTGVDLEHPDLAGNLTSPAGRDFVDNDNDPDDENDLAPNGTPWDVFHGTHVAGTAAAIENNSIGVAGVAPDARILAVRVLDDRGRGTSGDIASGIAYAAQQGADVINASLGGLGSDPIISNAVDVANASNAVVVAAAGNESRNNDEFPQVPCVLPQANLICVASIDNNGLRSGFSNYGPTTVDVGAPGGGIRSTQGTDPPAYQFLDGTSMAAPHVSGVAALVRRGDPAALDTEIVQAIKQSVRRLTSLVGDTSTGGLVDSGAAIRRARALPIRAAAPPPSPTPPSKASFRRSKRSIRASRTGRFRFSFTAGAGLRGRITLKTVRRVRPRSRGRRRITTFANKTFRVPSSGRVTVRFKLSRRNRRILARYKRLRISVTVKLRNSANLTSTARVRITLRAPRRPRR